MPDPLFGVDSHSRADTMVRVPRRFQRQGRAQEYLFDYVCRRAGRMPRFWGRYLNVGHSTRMHPDEVNFILERSDPLGQTEHRCRILPVYNGIRRQPQGQQRGRQGGEDAAAEAITLANEFSIPHGVCIYLDLEGWDVSPEFIEGWWVRMRESAWGEAVGLYGRGAEMLPRRGTHLPDLSRPARSYGWARSVSRAEDRVDDEEFEALLGDLDAGRTNRPMRRFVWSNIPRRYDEHRDTPPNAEIIPPAFGAVGPVGATLTDTVVWQYRFGAFWPAGAARGSVDLDLALPLGYEYMWRR